MNVLVGCERSGIIREAFRKLGHEAWSCDLAPAEDSSPYHLQYDVFEAVGDGSVWDLFIVHPDCRFLSNSGALRLYLNSKKVNGIDRTRWANMETGAQFFRRCLQVKIPRVCVENPVMYGHAKRIIGMEPTQSIQPYEFGEDASKRTCLWLLGLPPLEIDPAMILVKDYYANQTPSGQNKLGPSPKRAMDRARTYPAIAGAMALQWGGDIRR